MLPHPSVCAQQCEGNIVSVILFQPTGNRRRQREPKRFPLRATPAEEDETEPGAAPGGAGPATTPHQQLPLAGTQGTFVVSGVCQCPTNDAPVEMIFGKEICCEKELVIFSWTAPRLNSPIFIFLGVTGLASRSCVP